jgi:hypothetical protein
MLGGQGIREYWDVRIYKRGINKYVLDEIEKEEVCVNINCFRIPARKKDRETCQE